MGSCCSAQHKALENEPVKLSSITKKIVSKNSENDLNSQKSFEDGEKVDPKVCVEKSNSQEIQSKETASLLGVNQEAKKDKISDNLNESKLLSDIKPEQNVIAPLNDLKEVNPFNLSRINEGKSFNKILNSEKNQKEIPPIFSEKGDEINSIPMNMPDQASLIEELKDLEKACTSSIENKVKNPPESNANKYPSLIVIDTIAPIDNAGVKVELDINYPKLEGFENKECEIDEENLAENNPPSVNNKIFHPLKTKFKSDLDNPVSDKEKREILKDLKNVAYSSTSNKDFTLQSNHPYS